MAGRGTDILLGGNPEQMTRDHFLKNKLAMPYAAAPAVIAADPSDGNGAQPTVPMVLFQHEGKIFQVPADHWKPMYEQFAEQCKAEHDEVVALGGLHILGTERHEARRIDNQLRGRSGRQGDPGSSRFYLSLEDPLLRIFAGERVNAIMQRLGMPEGEPIEHGLVTRSIESAQRKVEAHNFDIRKQLLEYDNVANDQRREIYQLRNSILESQDVSEQIAALREGVVTDFFRAHVPEESMEEQWDIPGLEKVYAAELRLDLPLSKWLESDPGLDDDALLKRAIGEAHAAYARKM